MLNRARGTIFLAMVVVAAAHGAAWAQDVGFATFLDGLRRDALARGIRPATLDAALAGVQPIPRVIELDRKQPEFTLTFAEYMARVVPEARVRQAREKLRQNRNLLDEVGRRFGVQPRFIVAFWGIESDFGRLGGGFPVIPALATLAFDGRRSAYFRRELLNALMILDQNHVDVGRMKGSWAGAMGQFQFMPSSFLAYAVDYDGDGRKDIWTSLPDTFASAANYLAKSGWKGDQTWGRSVSLPAGFDGRLADGKGRKSLREWQALGVRRAESGDLPARDLMAVLVRAEGDGSPAFLVYDNYETILKWNRSTFFGIAVGSLADRIGGG